MKTITETWYEVLQPDGGWMYNEVIAKFSTEAEAIKYKQYLGDGWPRTIKENKLNVVIYEYCEELLIAKEEKKRIQEEIKQLQEKLKAL